MQTERQPTSGGPGAPASRQRRHPRTVATVVFTVILGLAAFGTGWWLQTSRVPDPDFAYGMKLAQPRTLRPVTLTGAAGPVQLPYQDGKWTLVFFGYTHCPDVCPTTLTYLKGEMKALGPRRSHLHTLFVSVDPQRDTPADLQRFVTFYDAAFEGVTGDKAALDQMTTDAGAAYFLGAKAAQGATDYDVSHSNSIYVVNPRGQVVAVYGGEGKPGKLAQDFHFLPETP
jgi:protein SCO1/2